MPDFAAPLQRLIDEFRRLPGIGQKSAQRLAFYVLRSPRDQAAALAAALTDVKDNLGICAECNNISDAELCPYCRDPNRDRTAICIVEEPHAILPVETTRSFNGLYHVLHGAISPLRGIGPEEIDVAGLVSRITPDVREVVIATNPNVEGEATALYLARRLKASGVRVTRIAFGLPVGGDIEYADEVTMARSLENRRDL